jgi:hypothetical protein
MIAPAPSFFSVSPQRLVNDTHGQAMTNLGPAGNGRRAAVEMI